MATFYQTLSTEQATPKLYTSIVAQAKRDAVAKFKTLFHASAFLHLSFSLFLLLQLFITIALFVSDKGSLFAPTSLAMLFLGVVSYTLIAFYQKNRKLDTIEQIVKEYHRTCVARLGRHIEDHGKAKLAISACMRELSDALLTQELFYLKIPPFTFSNQNILSFVLYFHYGDILYLQEKLLEFSLEEHSYLLADAACDGEFHSSLSKTYSALSAAYKKPKGKHLEKAFAISTFFKRKEIATEQEKYYNLAVEELQIVKELSGKEAWVLQELATLYRQFDRAEEEMAEYEELIHKVENDKEILYRLGYLYFQHHKTAAGLKVYNTLRVLDALYAKNLLSHYHF